MCQTGFRKILERCNRILVTLSYVNSENRLLLGLVRQHVGVSSATHGINLHESNTRSVQSLQVPHGLRITFRRPQFV